MKSSWAILPIFFQSFGNKNKKVSTKFFFLHKNIQKHSKTFSANRKITLNVAFDFELVFSIVTVINELNKHLNLDHESINGAISIISTQKNNWRFCFVLQNYEEIYHRKVDGVHMKSRIET